MSDTTMAGAFAVAFGASGWVTLAVRGYWQARAQERHGEQRRWADMIARQREIDEQRDRLVDSLQRRLASVEAELVRREEAWDRERGQLLARIAELELQLERMRMKARAREAASDGNNDPSGDVTA